MSNKVTIEQTPTGWHVEVTDADLVTIDTDGADINVAVTPDQDDSPRPLDVHLG